MISQIVAVVFLVTCAQAGHHEVLETLSKGESWNNVNLRSGKPVKVVAVVGHGGLGGDGGNGGWGHGGGLGGIGGGGHGHEEKIIDYLAPAKYAFKYGVLDGHTGDKKEQEEVREGDVVKGQYSIAEPDGTILTVKYVADKKRGFNAQVIRTGHSYHPKVATKVVNPVNIRAGHGLGGWGGENGGY